MLAPPDQNLVAEIDALIEEIKDIQAAHDRPIAQKMKRSRKGRTDILALAALLDVPMPEDLRALYWNWNGAEGSGRMTHWDTEVFFGYRWDPASSLSDYLQIAQLEKQTHANAGPRLFFGWRNVPLIHHCPLAVEGVAPLMATEPWAQRLYFAFDGLVPMLQSYVAAEKAGVISYAAERVTAEDGTIIVEAGEIGYDPAELWEAIAPHNPRTADAELNFWRARATGTLEFDGTPPDISSGVLEIMPEVQAIMFRDLIEDKKRQDGRLQKKLTNK